MIKRGNEVVVCYRRTRKRMIGTRERAVAEQRSEYGIAKEKKKELRIYKMRGRDEDVDSLEQTEVVVTFGAEERCGDGR